MDGREFDTRIFRALSNSPPKTSSPCSTPSIPSGPTWWRRPQAARRRCCSPPPIRSAAVVSSCRTLARGCRRRRSIPTDSTKRSWRPSSAASGRGGARGRPWRSSRIASRTEICGCGTAATSDWRSNGRGWCRPGNRSPSWTYGPSSLQCELRPCCSSTTRRLRSATATAATWRRTCRPPSWSSSMPVPAASFWADERIVDAAVAYLDTAQPRAVDESRVLATIVMTDMVSSTLTLAQMGDRRWREVLDAHDRATGRQIGDAVPGAPRESHGRRSGGDLRWPGTWRPLRRSGVRRGRRTWCRRAGRGPRRGERVARPRDRGYRSAPGGPGDVGSRRGSGRGDADGQGSDGRLRSGLRRYGSARAQGHTRPLAAALSQAVGGAPAA